MKHHALKEPTAHISLRILIRRALSSTYISLETENIAQYHFNGIFHHMKIRNVTIV